MTTMQSTNASNSATVENTSQPHPNNIQRRLRQFATQILGGLAFTAVLSAAGFYVVHFYLFKVTHLFTYKIETITYVAAGINLIIGTVATIIWQIYQLLTENTLAFIAALIPLIILIWFLGRHKRLDRIVSRINRWVLYISLLLVILLIALVYGWNSYEYSPRLLGGGLPAKVILLFSQPDKLSAMGLPIPTNATYPAQSEPVKLLMELNDGVLVVDFETQVPVIIKNDLLYGMIDGVPPTQSQTPSPTPTISPTP